MTSPAWPARGEIHILLADLDEPQPEVCPSEPILSPDELLRADRLLSPRVRDRFMAGRAFLRRTLSRYLELPPAQLRLTTNEHGKPRLAGKQAGSGLCFNLSHSDNLAILALADGCEVGVDMERIQEGLEFHAMAKRYFSLREREELFSLPPERRLHAFYRCWTRKEACLKGRGSGFSQPADCCDVSLLSGHTSQLSLRSDVAEPEHWNLMDLDVPAGFCAALAAKGRIRTVRFVA